MRNKSVIAEARQIHIASDLIRLGARLQVLTAETELSRERLLKLYKEIRGVSPPKGMLPFSTDWFLSWQPNVHASLFLQIHRYMTANAELSSVEALVKSYRLYGEHVEVHGYERVLSVTRAWSLLRFLDAKMLSTVACCECGGHFLVDPLDMNRGYVCGLCRPPSRAGKTRQEARGEQAPVRELEPA